MARGQEIIGVDAEWNDGRWEKGATQRLEIKPRSGWELE